MPEEHTALHQGLVVASHGRHCVVESLDGSRRICHPRGKKNQPLVGDVVQWAAQPSGQGDEGVIEQILPRRNLLYRQDDVRTKAFAANIDQVLLWLAAEPEFSHQLLGRALLAAEAAQIAPLIVLNKMDLADLHARGWQRLAPYRAMGYKVLAQSLKDPACPHWPDLLAALHGKKTLVMGPSGTGKSTLVNRLLPHAGVETAEISRALNSGKHTTTSTLLYWVDRAASTAVIDSPGFQEFGIAHLQADALAALMPDIARHTGQCRFYNCTHIHEPGCGVRAAVGQDVEAGGIDSLRHQFYADLFTSLSQVRY